MKYKYLSYALSDDMPVFGGRADMEIRAVRAISKGDSSNMYRFSMENHWGTHVDAPRHFFDNGKSIEDYPPSTWFFEAPQVINLSLKPSEVVKMGRWVKKINLLSDILIFKSGWSCCRNQKKYVYQNPGVAPEVGNYLRKNHRSLRAIGIDWISISPYTDRALGREAHRAFLSPEGKGRPLLIVEDMRLPLKLTGLKSVLVSPLIVSGTDSAVCTVLGAFHD